MYFTLYEIHWKFLLQFNYTTKPKIWDCQNKVTQIEYLNCGHMFKPSILRIFWTGLRIKYPTWNMSWAAQHKCFPVSSVLQTFCGRFLHENLSLSIMTEDKTKLRYVKQCGLSLKITKTALQLLHFIWKLKIIHF